MHLTRTFSAAFEAALPRPNNEPELFSIGDTARAYGVSLRALRFYEDRSLLRPIRNGTTRLYDARARLRLQMILKGKQLGFTLAEIREMLRAKGDDALPEFELALQPEQVLSQINLLQRQRETLDSAIEELKRAHEQLAAAAAQSQQVPCDAKAG
jgi:DNA-binding transcriptional MerR regulator